ncbi:MAG TPA: hypothetical protein VNG70_08740 [Candidatus Limnocylindria bacterium]|nr:hypothetical protein [Candidatus Limnocylindria bacterium]
MTWKFKVQRVAFALGVVAVLAMGSGANWFGSIYGLLLDFYW